MNLRDSRPDELARQVDYWGKVVAAAALALGFYSGWEIARLGW